jgi:hypothetical protein
MRKGIARSANFICKLLQAQLLLERIVTIVKDFVLLTG